MMVTHLIDGDPVLHTIPKPVEAELSIRQKVEHNLFVVVKAAVSILKLQRMIPMKDGHPGRDVGSEKRINLNSVPSRVHYRDSLDRSST